MKNLLTLISIILIISCREKNYTNANLHLMKKRPIDNRLVIKKKLIKIVEEMNIDEHAKINQDPRGIAIEFDGSVCFGSGSIALNPEIKRILDPLKKGLE